jgi:hypothetical protein
MKHRKKIRIPKTLDGGIPNEDESPTSEPRDIIEFYAGIRKLHLMAFILLS